MIKAIEIQPSNLSPLYKTHVGNTKFNSFSVKKKNANPDKWAIIPSQFHFYGHTHIPKIKKHHTPTSNSCRTEKELKFQPNPLKFVGVLNPTRNKHWSWSTQWKSKLSNPSPLHKTHVSASNSIHSQWKNHKPRWDLTTEIELKALPKLYARSVESEIEISRFWERDVGICSVVGMENQNQINAFRVKGVFPSDQVDKTPLLSLCSELK